MIAAEHNPDVDRVLTVGLATIRCGGRVVTENKLKGLFGGGEAGDTSADEGRDRHHGGRRRRQMSADDTARAQDFIQRYRHGRPDEGFSSDEAINYLQQLRGEAPPEVLQRAAVNTVNNLPEDQRKAFAEMLQRRQQSQGMVTIERSGQAHAAEGRTAPQGGGDILGSLFGGLLGGMAVPEPQPMPRTQPAPSGGGIDDMLGGLLGGLLGSGAQTMPQGRNVPANDPFGDILGGVLGGGQPEPHHQRQEQQQDGGIGDILGSPLGKAVLGGIAAYAMQEMMDRNRRG